VGSVLAFIGIFFLGNKVYYPTLAGFLNSTLGLSLGPVFPYNYQVTIFAVALLTILTYVVVSLLTCQAPYDLDKLLYRGAYADEKSTLAHKQAVGWKQKLSIANLLRFDANFTTSDRWITSAIFLWSMLLLIVNAVISIWNVAFQRWSIHWWDRYSLVVSIGVPFIIALGSLFWFGIGGVLDTKAFFKALREMKRDDDDDGSAKKV
jgi:hypothetical protein